MGETVDMRDHPDSAKHAPRWWAMPHHSELPGRWAFRFDQIVENIGNAKSSGRGPEHYDMPPLYDPNNDDVTHHFEMEDGRLISVGGAWYWITDALWARDSLP